MIVVESKECKAMLNQDREYGDDAKPIQLWEPYLRRLGMRGGNTIHVSGPMSIILSKPRAIGQSSLC